MRLRRNAYAENYRQALGNSLTVRKQHTPALYLLNKEMTGNPGKTGLARISIHKSKVSKKEALETIESMIKIRERDARNLRKNYPDATNEWTNYESAYNLIREM